LLTLSVYYLPTIPAGAKLRPFIKRLTTKKQGLGSSQSWTLQRKIQRILDLDDFAGVIAKVSLLGGLDCEELLTLNRLRLCSSDLSICNCSDIHVLDNSFDLTFIATAEFYPRYFTILPNILWQNFRSVGLLSECDLALAEVTLRTCGLSLGRIAEISADVVRVSGDRFDNSTDESASLFSRDHVQLLCGKYRNTWNRFLTFE
jgi:hypothetical protein